MKAYHKYANRSLSDYATKRSRKSGISTSYLSIQINAEILSSIDTAAKEDKTDTNDWIIQQLLDALERNKKDNRPIKDKIDRPRGKR